MLMYRAFFSIANFTLLGEKKMYLVIVIEQYSIELFIYYVMTMYRLCIYYYYLGSSGLS